MNKPEQLRLAADIIEQGLEWEWQWVATRKPDVWLKSGSHCLAERAMNTIIRIKPTDPHPNRKEVEEGIRQGRRWQFKDLGEDESKWRTVVGSPGWFLDTVYRLAPEPKKVPLGPEDITPGSIIRGRCHNAPTTTWCGVLGVFSGHIKISSNDMPCEDRTYQDLKDDKLEISRDFGRTWHPCEKDETTSTTLP